MKKTITTQYNSFTTSTGTTFYTNESQTYFYATWVEGEGPVAWRKQKRIKKAEYEAAKREHELEVDAKMHENLEKLVAETEESNTDEEVAAIIESMDADAESDSISAEELIEKVEKVEKEKKVRKAKKAKAAKKNAAFSKDFGSMTVTLTEKQVDFIRHLPDTCFWEEGLDSCIWVDCLCDDIKGQFKDKPMTVGAMISTICEKGLGNRGTDRRNGRKCTSFRLTDMGKQVAAELGVR